MINFSRFRIGSERCFIIAEIGNNHNGNFDRAIKMIDEAYNSGADCVKFQMRVLDRVYRRKSLNAVDNDLNTEYSLDLLRRFELSVDQHFELSRYCSKLGIPYLCTPWDDVSVGILNQFGVPGFKVASADLTNMELLTRLIETKKPLILSTGMSLEQEVITSVDLLRRHNTEFVLLHCNSTYPAPIHDINLRWMNRLRQLHPLVGYSGHERGINISIAAAALGACVIERHFTLNKHMEGPDHAASLLPNEFRQMVDGIREVEEALGQGERRVMSQGELMNRENLGKSLVASMPLKRGTVIETDHIKTLSPGQGLSPQRLKELIGCCLRRDLDEEDFFFESDLQSGSVGPRSFAFQRNWGIPVRYHDYRQFSRLIKPNLWEFHLSYSDMDLNPHDYIQEDIDANLVVHAPELFSNSHLMDLTSPDEDYRDISLRETQRVIDITKLLRTFFPNSRTPLIVANIGGFSTDSPFIEAEKTVRYERFGESLRKLDLAGVELIPQTMAPFPWHFGGQRYQNLFLKPEEIIFWCKTFGLRICLDISHSKLTCNHFGIDFYDFIQQIAPYTAHIHIGDARGLNGEGLQIGEGEIDFDHFATVLNEHNRLAGFIPEIWQGHKDMGFGFWQALDRLEGKL